jgi:hypothetical protein
MSDLTAGMYSGVRPAGAGDGQRLRQPQYNPDGLFQLALHGTKTLLTGPAVESRSVVPEINPPTHTAI